MRILLFPWLGADSFEYAAKFSFGFFHSYFYMSAAPSLEFIRTSKSVTTSNSSAIDEIIL